MIIKKLLITVIGMTALGAHSVAQDEMKPVESIEAYCKILEENFDNPDRQQVNHAIERIYDLDTWPSMSHRNQEALYWIRKLLRRVPGIAPFETDQEFIAWAGSLPKKSTPGQGFRLMPPLRYLVEKGDERDLDLICIPHWREKLVMRVAGTNLFNYHYAVFSHDYRYHNFLEVINHGIYDIVPSVTNTGPQAHYVLEILRQYWMKMDPPTDKYWGTAKDTSQIPDELLTMVVWFDEDGNPVCNVDLAKYGLTMPEIDLPRNVKDEILRRARPNAAAESPPLTGDDAQRPEVAATTGNPPNRLWIYVGVISVLCAGAVLWCLRKKR